MKEVHLLVEKRVGKGKEFSKKIRKKGAIPAIIYGKGIEPMPISIKYSEFDKLYKKIKGETVIFNLEFTDNKNFTKKAILKEIQRNPITDKVIHLDFQSIEEGKPLEVEVPIEFIGKPLGLTKGGILEIMLHTLTIECLPTDMPDKIVVDLSSLDLGDSLHVRDIKIPEGIKIKDNPEETVATVVEEKSAPEETVEESSS